MDLAKLGIEVDGKDITKAMALLSQLADVVAPKAEKAVDEIGDAAEQAGKKTSGFGGAVSKFRQSISDSLSPLNLFKGALVGVAATMSLSMLGNLSDSYTEFRNRLTVAKVSAEDFAGVQDRLSKAANANGVSVNAASSLYAKMSQNAGALGAKQKDLLNAVDGISAALKVNGGSAESASGALMQLGQSLGSGVVRAEEFNSMLEGAPTILQMAANGIKSTGGSVAALRAQMLAGNLTSKQLFDGILKGSAAMQAQAGTMAMSISAGFQSLTNGLILFIGQLDQATGISSLVASSLAAIGDGLTWLGSNLSTIGNLVMSFSPLLAAMFGPMLLTGITAVATILGGSLLSAFNGLTVAARLFAGAVMANPLIAIPALIISVVTALYQFREELGLVGGKWDAVWGGLSSGVQYLWDGVKNLGSAIYSVGEAFANSLGDSTITLLSALWGVIKQVGAALWETFGPAVVESVKFIVSWLREMLNVVTEVVTAIGKVVSAITGQSIGDDAAGKIESAADKSAARIEGAHRNGGQSAATGMQNAIVGGGNTMRNEITQGSQTGANAMRDAITSGGQSAATAIRGAVVQAAARGGNAQSSDAAWNADARRMDAMFGGGGGGGGNEDLGEPDKRRDGSWILKNQPNKYLYPEAYSQWMKYRADNQRIQEENKQKSLAAATGKPGTVSGGGGYTMSEGKYFAAATGQTSGDGVTIVNSFSPNDQLNALSTRKGRDTIANVIKSNPQQFNAALGRI